MRKPALLAGLLLPWAALAAVSTGFEALEVSSPLDVARNDAGLLQDPRHWSYAGTDGCGWIRAHDADMASETQTRHLRVGADARLARHFNRIAGGETAVPLGDGICFDALVRFSLSDSRPDEIAADDKFALWLEERDDGTTRLMLEAGRCDESLAVKSPHVYELNVIPEPMTWHRLTAVVWGDVTEGKGIPGLVLYLDGVALAAVGEAGFDPGLAAELNAAAARHLAARELFPCRAAALAGSQPTFDAIAFVGLGDVDDLALSTETPPFATEGATCRLRWRADGLRALAYALDGGSAVEIEPGEADSLLVDCGSGLEEHQLEVRTVANGEKGFSPGDVLARAGCAASGASDCFTVTIPALGRWSLVELSLAKAVARVGSTAYVELGQAVSAAVGAGECVTLLDDCDLASALQVAKNRELTLDLNGYALSGGNASGVIAVIGTLRLVDSHGGGSVRAGSFGVAVWLYGNAKLVIEGGRFEGRLQDNEVKAIELRGGCFPWPKAAESFEYAAWVAADCRVRRTEDGQYGEIVSKVPPVERVEVGAEKVCVSVAESDPELEYGLAVATELMGGFASPGEDALRRGNGGKLELETPRPKGPTGFFRIYVK